MSPPLNPRFCLARLSGGEFVSSYITHITISALYIPFPSPLYKLLDNETFFHVFGGSKVEIPSGRGGTGIIFTMGVPGQFPQPTGEVMIFRCHTGWLIWGFSKLQYVVFMLVMIYHSVLCCVTTIP